MVDEADEVCKPLSHEHLARRCVLARMAALGVMWSFEQVQA